MWKNKGYEYFWKALYVLYVIQYVYCLAMYEHWSKNFHFELIDKQDKT